MSNSLPLWHPLLYPRRSKVEEIVNTLTLSETGEGKVCEVVNHDSCH